MTAAIPFSKLSFTQEYLPPENMALSLLAAPGSPRMLEYIGHYNQWDTRAVHYGKVECNTVEFLYSDCLYFNVRFPHTQAALAFSS